MFLPQAQDKRVRLDHGSTTTYPYVALLPVQSRQLGDQLGRVKTHADRDGLKLVHFSNHNSLQLTIVSKHSKE